MRAPRRVYLAGPMTGLPDFNYPAFNAEAARLRALGYHVENPAENQKPVPETWENYLRAALRQMLTCDAVLLLPGFQSSRGAMLEMNTAHALSMPILMAGQVDEPPGMLAEVAA